MKSPAVETKAGEITAKRGGAGGKTLKTTLEGPASTTIAPWEKK